MWPSSPSSRHARLAVARWLRRLHDARAAGTVGDFSGLQQLLQPPQIFLNHLVWRLTDHPHQQVRGTAARRRVLEEHAQFGAAVPRRTIEPDRAPVIDLRSRQRAPGDAAIRCVLDRLRFPDHLEPTRSTRDPARSLVAEQLDRLEMGHEAGQVVELPPEPIYLFARSIDRERLRYTQRVVFSLLEAGRP